MLRNGLLRLDLNNIKQIITQKQDIQFLHLRLNTLKICWKYRYIKLRKRYDVALQKHNENINKKQLKITIDNQEEKVDHIHHNNNNKSGLFGNLFNVSKSKSDKTPNLNDKNTNSNSIRINTIRHLKDIFNKNSNSHKNSKSIQIPAVSPSAMINKDYTMTTHEHAFDNDKAITYPSTPVPNKWDMHCGRRETNRFQNFKNVFQQLTFGQSTQNFNMDPSDDFDIDINDENENENKNENLSKSQNIKNKTKNIFRAISESKQMNMVMMYN